MRFAIMQARTIPDVNVAQLRGKQLDINRPLECKRLCLVAELFGKTRYVIFSVKQWLP